MPLAVISKAEPFATAPGTPEDLTRKLEQVWPKVQSALVNLEPLTRTSLRPAAITTSSSTTPTSRSVSSG